MAHLDAGYTRGRPDLSWPVIQRRSLFLREVAHLAPHVLEGLAAIQADFADMNHQRVAAGEGPHLAWDEILEGAAVRSSTAVIRDHLLAWARTYHLEADWILSGAIEALARAGTRDPLVLTPPTAVILPPVSTPSWSYTVQGYNTLQSEYRERVLAGFTRALDQHIEDVTNRLREDPSVTRVEQVKGPTLKNIRHAVRWQVLGEPAVASTARAIRTELHRVGLKPRPGLV